MLEGACVLKMEGVTGMCVMSIVCRQRQNGYVGVLAAGRPR